MTRPPRSRSCGARRISGSTSSSRVRRAPRSRAVATRSGRADPRVSWPSRRSGTSRPRCAAPRGQASSSSIVRRRARLDRRARRWRARRGASRRARESARGLALRGMRDRRGLRSGRGARRVRREAGPDARCARCAVRSDPVATARAVAALIGALAAGGVRDACLAPGSRSAPLAIALERHPAIRVWPHLDERSAAFFGLGLARATRAPVVLLATSGTAAANFLPAVVEARQARVPLVVITADRPPELRDAGAPQTIDQQGLYGTYVKWTHELAIVDDDAEGEGYVRSVALRAIADATSAPAGPVHLNVPLREPLVPDPDTLPPVRVFGEVRLRAAPRPPDEDAVAALAADCAHAERGLIVCGPQDDPRLPATLVRLARITGFPVIADPLSLARFGPHDRSLVIDRYDALLRAEAIASAFAPDIVLRIGDTPTSKPLLDYLARHARAR